MAALKAIKIQSGENAGKYGVSNKVNSFYPCMGTYATRPEAVYRAEMENVSYYEQKSRDAYNNMLKLVKKNPVIGEVNQHDEIQEIGKDHYFDRGDLLC